MEEPMFFNNTQGNMNILKFKSMNKEASPQYKETRIKSVQQAENIISPNTFIKHDEISSNNMKSIDQMKSIENTN
jgi:hypothetical protein